MCPTADRLQSPSLASKATACLRSLPDSPFAAGENPIAIALDPSGSFAYVVNRDDNTLSAYTIDATGGLTAVAGSPYPTGSDPESVVIDPSGRFLYLSDLSAMWGYSIDSDTGALTELPDGPWRASRALAMVIDPSGKFLYDASNFGISGFTIDEDTGALSEMDPLPAYETNGRQASRSKPPGNSSYLIDDHSNAVAAYSIDADTGMLEEIDGQPLSHSFLARMKYRAPRPSPYRTDRIAANRWAPYLS